MIDPTSYEYVPYAAANMSSCYLGRGMSGSAVTALQKDLISCYGYKPATDGVYGELTESAVVAVQKRVGVKADGDYGSSTRLGELQFADRDPHQLHLASGRSPHGAG
ncbi:peptidoglycan-binding domain-containing protein [Streptomyces cellulosae]